MQREIPKKSEGKENVTFHGPRVKGKGRLAVGCGKRYKGKLGGICIKKIPQHTGKR